MLNKGYVVGLMGELTFAEQLYQHFLGDKGALQSNLQPQLANGLYRDTSLTKKRIPQGPYSRPRPGALWLS
jgi:hypothetical protein